VESVEVKGSKQGVSKILFENIYFDFNKADLKHESNVVLDKLSAFWRKHPETQIELSANTDSYGSSDYNKMLSQNRGNNALNYLISKGVDKAALVVTAEGEGKPVADNNSEIGRQLNRRVEFYILGGPGYVADASSIVINPREKTLYYVAKQFNMSVEELEKYMHHEKTSTTNRTITGSKTSGTDYYVVQPKNTLYSIARLYGMNVEELKQMNSITPNQGVTIGQKLKVKIKSETPGEGYHLVKEGETLYSISKKYGITVEQLVAINNMDGYVLRRSMILKIR
jgi:LysM repeat protein